MRYINKALGLSCFSDIATLKIFPNGKEITESFGAFEATKRFIPFFNHADNNLDIVCVGDGRTSRELVSRRMFLNSLKPLWD